VSSSTTRANYIAKNYNFCIEKIVQLKKSSNPAEGKGRNTKERTNARSQDNTQKSKEGKGTHANPNLLSLGCKSLTNRVKQITQREGKLQLH
jgi:hypothetical protein